MAPRILALTLCLSAACLLGLGCNILEGNLLDGYYYTARHFKRGTVAERQINQTFQRAIVNTKTVCKEEGIGVERIDRNGDQALVFASKKGLKFVIEINRSGEESCLVRVEIDQAGNSMLAETILTDLEAFP